MWIQTGVTVRKRLSWVVTSVTLTFDLWPWPFAWTLAWSLVITPENFMMIRWWEHSQKGVTDGQTDGQTDRRTENTIHRAAWSQLKIIDGIGPEYGKINPIIIVRSKICQDIPLTARTVWYPWCYCIFQQIPIDAAWVNCHLSGALLSVWFIMHSSYFLCYFSYVTLLQAELLDCFADISCWHIVLVQTFVAYISCKWTCQFQTLPMQNTSVMINDNVGHCCYETFILLIAKSAHAIVKI